ncbi:hypothetical protein [Streptomyces sp. NPDC047981]|uniref:hypothetical protein n=1 Tax=Streptomyces sp. NPDC047981 TaxID=3154610 RepID=UPI0034353E1B
MLTLATGDFYESGTFWAAVGVFVALLVGLGAMWATLRSRVPQRRRLLYAMSSTSLLQEQLNGRIEVRHTGTSLAEPRLVQIRLTNVSRRDVSSASFDRNEPIKIAVGRQILELLSAETRPQGAAAPPVTVQGDELHVGPGRLGRRESVTFFLLVDGDPSYSHWHALIDVGFDEEPEVSYSTRELNHTVLRVFLSALVIFALLLSVMGRSK